MASCRLVSPCALLLLGAPSASAVSAGAVCKSSFPRLGHECGRTCCWVWWSAQELSLIKATLWTRAERWSQVCNLVLVCGTVKIEKEKHGKQDYRQTVDGDGMACCQTLWRPAGLLLPLLSGLDLEQNKGRAPVGLRARCPGYWLTIEVAMKTRSRYVSTALRVVRAINAGLHLMEGGSSSMQILCSVLMA